MLHIFQEIADMLSTIRIRGAYGRRRSNGQRLTPTEAELAARSAQQADIARHNAAVDAKKRAKAERKAARRDQCPR